MWWFKEMCVTIINPSLPLPSQEEDEKVSSQACRPCSLCTKGLCNLISGMPHLRWPGLHGLMGSSHLMQTGNLGSDLWEKFQSERAVRSLAGASSALPSSYSWAQVRTLGALLGCVAGMPVPSLSACSLSPNRLTCLTLASTVCCHCGTVWWSTGCGWPWLPSRDLWDGAFSVVTSLVTMSPLAVACCPLQSSQLLTISWHAFWSHQCIVISSGHSGFTNKSTYVVAMSPLSLPNSTACTRPASQLLVKLAF